MKSLKNNWLCNESVLLFCPGFPEAVYNRALMIGFSFKERVEKNITYERKVIHKRKFDRIAENVVPVGLKARKEPDM